MYNAAGQPDKQSPVEHFVPLVKRIAHHLMSRLPPSVQFDDLFQNGMLGLLDAMDRFEDGMGAQFETYATQRIKGAMLDGLRENDTLPRHLRRSMRQIEEAIRRLEQKAGRPATESELAAEMGISLEEYQKTLQEARGHQLLYFEDFSGEDDEGFLDRHASGDEDNPARLLEDQDLRSNLVRAIERLPEREKLMMGLYYEQELNLKEIGEVLGVTESRVCQLHSQAIHRLRAQVLGEHQPTLKTKGKGRQHG